MKNYIESITQEMQNNLSRSAMEYLKTAVDLSMKGSKIRFTGDLRAQPVVGNFAIAVELMLKAFIFSKNPALVFNLPLELRVAFISPGSIAKDFDWRPFDMSLRSFEYTTPEMSELIKTFFVLRPDLKQELQPFFSLFSHCRNVSVHSSLPSFQKYEIERTAYLAMRLFNEISPLFGIHRRGILREGDAILAKLDIERANKVRKKIASAKKAAKSLEGEQTASAAVGWDRYVTECPVCGSEGLLIGDTDIDYGHSEGDMSLNFLAESFQCNQCKLVLSDIKEMALAGVSTVYERNEDIDNWMIDHEDYIDHEFY